MNKIKAVELFAGIGGFRVACDDFGINTLWANEIDPIACTVYRKNFGNNELCEADVKKVLNEIPNHDLLTGGFPCQPFSSAGKKKGVFDTRGTLFESIASILKIRQPKFFILENVKRILSMQRGFHYKVILERLNSLGYSIEWRLINSAALGLAQNRERVVITGRLESTLSDAYLVEESSFDGIPQKEISNLSYPIDLANALQNKGFAFKNWGKLSEGKLIQADLDPMLGKTPKIKVKDILEKKVDKKYFFNEETKKRIKESVKVDKFVNGVEILYNQKGGARMGYTIFGLNGLAPTLTCQPSRHYERYKLATNQYRRLTNIEYARLQGFKDEHAYPATPRSQYFLFGNAVPPQIVYWTLEQIFKPGSINLNSINKQMELL